jgi:hypothetical protein
MVMMSQQESIDEGTRGSEDDPVLGALYSQAVADGMRTMTLRSALPFAQNFSANPRAIAFPYLPGGSTTAYNGVPFTPATIDYHDDVAGMTFIAGHALPARLFTYANDPTSTFNHTLVVTLPTDPLFPSLIGFTYAKHALTFTFEAPVSVHIGVALWSDPAQLKLSGGHVTPAGHGGAVLTFDLPAGRSARTVRCDGCNSETLPYAT